MSQRTRSALPAGLEKNVKAYALTGVTGLSILFAPRADGAIHYTLANAQFPGDSSVSIDFNKEGVADFTIFDYFQSGLGDAIASLTVTPLGQNGVATDSGRARAINFLAEIGPNLRFGKISGFSMAGNVETSEDPYPSPRGEFANVTNKYLGLRLSFYGKTYYGWARVNVNIDGAPIYGELVDYAYQDLPNVPILAGQGIKKGGQGSLGALASGANLKPSGSE